MEIKERILKGSEELFFKFGIKSVTVDDIARHLSISKKTIYQFYSNKKEIVNVLLKSKLDEDKATAERIYEESENIIVGIFELMKYLSQLTLKINPIIFYELQKYYPKTWKLFLEFKEYCIENFVEKSIRKGVAAGLVRDDFNPKIIARLRMEELRLGFDPSIFPPDKFKVLDVQLELLDHFLYGICTIKGHKLINKYKQVTEEE